MTVYHKRGEEGEGGTVGRETFGTAWTAVYVQQTNQLSTLARPAATSTLELKSIFVATGGGWKTIGSGSWGGPGQFYS